MKSIHIFYVRICDYFMGDAECVTYMLLTVYLFPHHSLCVIHRKYELPKEKNYLKSKLLYDESFKCIC